MGGYVYAECKTAHYDRRLLKGCCKVFYEAFGERNAVRSGVPGADNAYYVLSVQVAFAGGEKHQRGILAVGEPHRIRIVPEIQCLYIVGSNEVHFPSGFFQSRGFV